MSELTRVLFVDDEPKVLDGLRRLLRPQRNRWSMHFAQSGSDALATMQQTAFDVVVSDMRMPEMDGATLLSEIKTRYPQTVRIILSGQSDHEAILRTVGPAHQFLSKPCDPEQLVHTIETSCRLQETLHSEAIQKVVAKIERLPSVPDLYMRLLETLAKPDTSAEQVGKIISRDVGMSAMVLKLVSSSFFGLPTHITSVEHAVTLLGLNLLKPLVLTAHIFSYYRQTKVRGFSPEAMMQHGVRVASAARSVLQSEHASQTEIEHTFLAGMLHDVGKLVMATSLPTDYDRAVSYAFTNNLPLVAAEQEILGTTHAEIGGYLLGLWGLPAPIVEAVTFHHRPRHSTTSGIGPLTAIHVCDVFLHHLLVEPCAASLPPLDTDYLQRIDAIEKLNDWLRLCSETKP